MEKCYLTWQTVALAIVLIIATAAFNDAQQAQASNRQPILQTNEHSIKFNTLNINDTPLKLHYAYAGNSDKPGILFIHGTPGSWSAFSTYLDNKQLQQDFFMISVDRLGWGQSSKTKTGNAKAHTSQSLTDFSVQANAINILMQHYPHKKWLLIGHSLGASIAPKVILNTNQDVTGMLLLAGSLNPNLGKPRWYNRLASLMLINWMLPRTLKQSNKEIMPLRTELEKIESELMNRQLSSNVIIMQGMKDNLVSPKNAHYASQNWKNHFTSLQVIELSKEDHFFLWQQPDQVIQSIYKFKFN